MNCRRVHIALIALALLPPVAAAWAATPAAASAPAPSGHTSAPAKKAPAAKPVKPVDINSASRAQLKTLPGIGDVQADKIVAGRPYLSKADLATKQVLPEGVYLSLKHRIIAIQKTKPKAKS